MPVLVTSNFDDDSIKNKRASLETASNFDDDSIKNKRASLETAFSHYKSMGIFLHAQGQLTP